MVSDLDKILLTSVLTILGGLLIHVLSQMFIKVFLEPCVEFKKSRGDVITYLTFYSNMHDSRLRHNDADGYKNRYYKAQDDIRLSMAKFRSSYYSITPHRLAVLLGITPRFQTFENISNNLLKLSFLGDLKEEGDKMLENTRLAKETFKLLKVRGY
ncbi:hypothetical protein [Paraglaciecola sp.]|uniref:hypothetical protein n=1 Tax=Paraglaciecola sp. TaxID=1920173 RepID=UPI0030F3F918